MGSTKLTSGSFGLHTKPRSAEEIRARFTQAVAEVYALKEAGLDMDISKSPNQGIYDIPRWVRKIKLYKTDSGELALAYPPFKSANDFLQAMQTVPEWESAPTFEPVEEEELLVEEAADLLEPVLPVEPVPTMDPATPAFKRAAVVKLDSEKKPFDFMSNRPVPRAKPVEAEKVEEAVEAAKVQEALEADKVEEALEIAEVMAEPPVAAPELVSAVESSQAAVNKLRYTELDDRARQIADEIFALQQSIQFKQAAAPSTTEVEEIKWRHVPIPSLDVKFAVSISTVNASDLWSD
jgi:hypothetical protein